MLYPSSNGYNSYQDRDETSIGGLKYPPKISKNLFKATLLLDILAVIASLLVSIWFSLFSLIFILVSRSYSSRRIRLKKYPIIGFITVFIFQGAFVYLMAASAISNFSFEYYFTLTNIICMCVASLFIGSIYPLTQIYQHEADKKDGVISLSYKLGYRGTFIFSSTLFTIASLLLFYYFGLKHQKAVFVIFLIIMLPVIVKLLFWFNEVRKDTQNANFENTMSMNLLTSICMNIYFVILILNNSFTWI